MATITVHRHPARVYTWLYETYLEKGQALDVKVFGLSVEPAHNNALATGAIRLLHSVGEPYITDVKFESQDEELLCWLSLAVPE